MIQEWRAIRSPLQTNPSREPIITLMDITGVITEYTADLEKNILRPSEAGAKGANLSLMGHNGFSVPPGFVILTKAYAAFVRYNNLGRDIAAISERVRSGAVGVKGGSSHIRLLMERGRFPTDIEELIRREYEKLRKKCPRTFRYGASKDEDISVAVRSSATAEDLPDASFAGQQDTILDVSGADELLFAVRKCWAGLWTERAMRYRIINNVPEDGLSMAVVVQVMVRSRFSGVLFTADPLSEDRDRMLLEYTPGTGDQLVSGCVDPVKVSLGRRKWKILPEDAKGEIEDGATRAKDGSKLTRKRIMNIFRMGARLENIFLCPQDIEWAEADGKIHVLQSRPMTTLYPLVKPNADWASPHLYVSFNGAEGMEVPFTPLGIHAVRRTFSRFRTLGRTRNGKKTREPVFADAGGRIYCDVTPFLRGKVLSPAMMYLLAQFFSGEMNEFRELMVSTGFNRGPGTDTGEELRYLAMPLPAAGALVRGIIAPDRARERYVERAETLMGRAEEEISRVTNLAGLLDTMDRFLDLTFWELILPAVALGMVGAASLRALGWAVDGEKKNTPDTHALTGGEHNVTVEMNHFILKLGTLLKNNRRAGNLAGKDLQKLASMYISGRLPHELQKGLDEFMRLHGHRGPDELDLGSPGYRDKPEMLFEMLVGCSPRGKGGKEKHRKGTNRRTEEKKPVPEGLKWPKRAVAGWAAGRIKALGGIREAPRFYTVKLSALLREQLIKEGEKLKDRGDLDEANDIFFLLPDELLSIQAGEDYGIPEKVANRKREYERQRRMRRFPLMVSHRGRAVYAGGTGSEDNAGEGESKGEDKDKGKNTFQCSPVSPGTVRGRVRVVDNPHTPLQPGKIIVCRMTNPGWTPLFPYAEGLIMEIGGAATHGAIVAREYGLPAVAGFPRATEILKDGDEVIVYGSSGKVVRMDRKK